MKKSLVNAGSTAQTAAYFARTRPKALQSPPVIVVIVGLGLPLFTDRRAARCVVLTGNTFSQTNHQCVERVGRVGIEQFEPPVRRDCRPWPRRS